MAYGRTKGGWRRGTQGLKRAGSRAFDWRIVGDTGAAVAIPGSIESPDWHACLEHVAAHRRAFIKATTFRVVGGAPRRVAFEFTIENVDRWDAYRAGREYVGPPADIPRDSGRASSDAGTAPVRIETYGMGIVATLAPWEA